MFRINVSFFRNLYRWCTGSVADRIRNINQFVVVSHLVIDMLRVLGVDSSLHAVSEWYNSEFSCIFEIVDFTLGFFLIRRDKECSYLVFFRMVGSKLGASISMVFLPNDGLFIQRYIYFIVETRTKSMFISKTIHIGQFSHSKFDKIKA